MSKESLRNVQENELLELLKKHANFTSLRDYIENQKGKTTTSWEGLVKSNPKEMLRELLAGSLFYSNKKILAYDTSKHLIAHDCNNGIDAGSKIEGFLKSKTKTESHEIVQKKEVGNFIIYTYKKNIQVKEVINLTREDLSSEARGRLLPFTAESAEIVLKKKIVAPVFNSLAFDTLNNFAYVLVDYCRYSIEESLQDFVSAFLVEVKTDFPSALSWAPVDLFETISEIYSTPTEGLITRLAFECETGAVRDEKLRRGAADLRKEVYHVKGKTALSNKILPYKLEVSWSKDDNNKEICTKFYFSIDGTRTASRKRAGVFKAAICAHALYKELCFALNKVSLYASSTISNP